MSSSGSKADDLGRIAGDERSTALRSTWINRLHLKSQPPSQANKPKPEKEKEAVNGFGFGPFLIRDREGNSSGGVSGNGPFPLVRRIGNLGGGERIGSREERGWQLDRSGVGGRPGVQLSPFFKVRSVGSAGYVFDGKANDAIRMSKGKEIVESSDDVMPASNGIRSSMFPSFSQRELICASPSQRQYNSESLQLVARSRAAPYHVDSADHFQGKMLHDPHMVHHSKALCNTVRQTSTCMNQHDEPFSFWNMGRFKIRNSTSSVNPTLVSQSSHLDRKRNPSTNYFLFSKSRKLGGGN